MDSESETEKNTFSEHIDEATCIYCVELYEKSKKYNYGARHAEKSCTRTVLELIKNQNLAYAKCILIKLVGQDMYVISLI